MLEITSSFIYARVEKRFYPKSHFSSNCVWPMGIIAQSHNSLSQEVIVSYWWEGSNSIILVGLT